MKLVFFDFSTLNYGGGCEKNFMNLGRWFSNRNYDVSFVTATNSLNNFYCSFARQGKHKENFSNQEIKDKFKVNKYLTFRFIDLFLRTSRRETLLKILREADAIISKNEIFEILILKFIFKVPFHKVTFGFHTPLYYPATKSLKSRLHNKLYSSHFYCNLLKNSRIRCLTLTNQDKELFFKNNLLGNISIIPNPLDTNKFLQKIYEKGGHFKVYYIGRMSEQKGIDTLGLVITALSVRADFKEMQFHFVGTGNMENILFDLSKKFENCYFHGFQSDIVPFYHDADLTLVPSRWEGFPYSVLEAQSCGIPVITTDTPGCKDIVRNEETGWICEIDNVDQIIEAVDKAYNLWESNFENYVAIGKNARVNVFENYEKDAINFKLEKFIFQKNDQ